MLEISGLTKQFDGVPALAAIARLGSEIEIVAILGTSGSGKRNRG